MDFHAEKKRRRFGATLSTLDTGEVLDIEVRETVRGEEKRRERGISPVKLSTSHPSGVLCTCLLFEVQRNSKRIQRI